MDFPYVLIGLLCLGFGGSAIRVITTFNVESYSSGPCYGGNSAGLGSTNLIVEQRSLQWIKRLDSIPIGARNVVINASTSGTTMFRLVQEEHGGGNCNCWELTFINTEFISDTESISNNCQ